MDSHSESQKLKRSVEEDMIMTKTKDELIKGKPLAFINICQRRGERKQQKKTFPASVHKNKGAENTIMKRKGNINKIRKRFVLFWFCLWYWVLNPGPHLCYANLA